MKTIRIDDEVYEALLAKIRDFGDTPNLVLRRELRVGDSTELCPARKTPMIQEVLDSTEFKFAKGAVGRFLAILSWLYKKDPQAFTLVEQIRGRGRLYFSKTVEELQQSGRSVNPKKIPGSPYWVITTTPTELKKQMLGDVMTELKFDSAEIQLAQASIAR